MSSVKTDRPHARGPGHPLGRTTETLGAWMLAILWLLPLVYAVSASVHHRDAATSFDLTAPLTLDNSVRV